MSRELWVWQDYLLRTSLFPITPREEGNIYDINVKFIRQNCDGGKNELPTLIIIDEAHLLEDIDLI